jgi:hypothetical protein
VRRLTTLMALSLCLALAGLAAADEKKLQDGTTVSVEGTKLFVVKDGQKTPAPDGLYKLEDGGVLKVMRGRVMTGPAVAPTEAAKPAEATAATPATPASPPAEEEKAKKKKNKDKDKPQ